jgi:hypothetical protein
VKIGEAVGLLSALVNFQLDSKVVVDNFHSNKIDDTDLGDIISHCRKLFSSCYNNSSVKFIRRQSNKVTHRLAKTALYIASSQIMVDMPYCGEHLLINDMI